MSKSFKKKKTNSEFIESISDEYCNLEIYPLVGILEREAGILSDLAELINAKYVLYGNNELESNQFVYSNLKNFKNSSRQVIARVSSEFTGNITTESIEALLCEPGIVDTSEFDFKIKLENMDKVLYLTTTMFDLFRKNIKGDPCKWDNLICLCMIVKDAGPQFEQILTDNLSIIDRWCILDTGSTDGTQDVIRRVLKTKRGTLYSEPFVDFKTSRNRCLELAGTTCKFILMLDDTYSVCGDLRNFLNEVRGDQYSDSFSLLIQSDDSEYYSNRIIKSNGGLRYIHRIHEVITDKNNVNVTIPPNKCFIFDNRSEYMEMRTTSRKQFDLGLLFQELEEFPDDPRALYYIAQTYGCLGDSVNKAKYFRKRLKHPEPGYIQEKIDAAFELARTSNFKLSKPWKQCEKYYR